MLVNEIALSYSKSAQIPDINFSNSLEVETFLRNQWPAIGVYESFYALHLNRAHKIVGVQLVGTGGISTVVVDLRLIFATAMKCLSTSIIIAHNHPSGQLKPSKNDKLITERASKACKIFDIKLLDHIILAPESGYFSFADEGIMPSG